MQELMHNAIGKRRKKTGTMQIEQIEQEQERGREREKERKGAKEGEKI